LADLQIYAAKRRRHRPLVSIPAAAFYWHDDPPVTFSCLPCRAARPC
jgi:hypothetical protein